MGLKEKSPVKSIDFQISIGIVVITITPFMTISSGPHLGIRTYHAKNTTSPKRTRWEPTRDMFESVENDFKISQTEIGIF